MCGIFAYIGHTTNVANILLDGLRKLDYRGYDSWGIAIGNDNVALVDKHVGKVGDAHVEMPQSNLGLGHTRWATHGGVTQANAHPHTDEEHRLAIIHNGIVENHDELRNKVLAAGHILHSETDTEVILYLIVDELKQYNSIQSSLTEAIRKVFGTLIGSNAIIVLDSSSDTIVAVKNGSPLCLGYGQDAYYIASDAEALLSYTHRVTFLEDGVMVVASPENVALKDVDRGMPVQRQILEVDWQMSQADLGEYPHYMLKEIYEQPGCMRSLVATSAESIQKLAQMIRDAPDTLFVGCGTAGNAALTGKYLLSHIADRQVKFEVGSEFGYLENLLTPHCLIIALSQSGETIDIIEPLLRAREEKDVKVAALVNVFGSTLFRMANLNVLLNAGPEKCVLATKSYTAKLSVLLLTAYALRGNLAEGQALLLKTADMIDTILNDKSQKQIAELAERIYQFNDLFVIGRGMSYPSSIEAALKIKEVSYIHAEGFAAGELKHGVISLIEQDTPCIVFVPDDETRDITLSNAMEIKARGGYIIGVGPQEHTVFDFYIPVGNAGNASPIIQAIPIQLLAYHLALKRGTDPDKPRNLAKSVTVR